MMKECSKKDWSISENKDSCFVLGTKTSGINLIAEVYINNDDFPTILRDWIKYKYKTNILTVINETEIIINEYQNKAGQFFMLRAEGDEDKYEIIVIHAGILIINYLVSYDDDIEITKIKCKVGVYNSVEIPI